MLHLLAIIWPGPFELMLLGGLALLVFARGLPQLGRAIGQGIVDFKRALRDAEDQIIRNAPEAQQPERRDGASGDMLLLLITAAVAFALLCVWFSQYSP